jgi:hypothetical protein
MIDEVLARIRVHLDLEADTEHDLLEEARDHLEEAVAAARGWGLDESEALAEAASRFGGEEVGRALRDAHAGRGTADGVIAAALPVICALLLRWLVFVPAGTAAGWQEALVRPAFWVVALVVLVVPVVRFPRWRYALASWAFFWVLSVIFVIGPALRW